MEHTKQIPLDEFIADFRQYLLPGDTEFSEFIRNVEEANGGVVFYSVTDIAHYRDITNVISWNEKIGIYIRENIESNGNALYGYKYTDYNGIHHYEFFDTRSWDRKVVEKMLGYDCLAVRALNKEMRGQSGYPIYAYAMAKQIDDLYKPETRDEKTWMIEIIEKHYKQDPMRGWGSVQRDKRLPRYCIPVEVPEDKKNELKGRIDAEIAKMFNETYSESWDTKEDVKFNKNIIERKFNITLSNNELLAIQNIASKKQKTNARKAKQEASEKKLERMRELFDEKLTYEENKKKMEENGISVSENTLKKYFPKKRIEKCEKRDEEMRKYYNWDKDIDYNWRWLNFRYGLDVTRSQVARFRAKENKKRKNDK